MSKELKIQVLLNAVDKATAPMRKVLNNAQALSGNIQKLKSNIQGLNKLKAKIEGFDKAKQAIEGATAALEKHRTKQKAISDKLANSKSFAQELKRKMNSEQLELNKLLEKQWDARHYGKGNLSQINTDVANARYRLAQLGKQYDITKNKVDEFNAKLRHENKTIKDSRLERVRQYQQFRQLRTVLKASGIDIKNLANHQITMTEKIKLANEQIEKQKAKLEKLNAVKMRKELYRGRVEALKSTSERLHNLGTRSMVTGATLTAPVVGMGKGVVGMTKTAGKFEQFNAILEITEGSAEKAKESFDWVKKFAVDTPSNLDEAMEAFVKLRAYGLDPTNGLLQTLGDTGAAMGKPVMQAVEAIADAVTGENERLKEFGVKGSVVKGTNIIEYQYTDKTGKQQVAKVDKNNRKQIEQTLSKIFNEKYAGAMEKQAKTISGIWAKLEDHWTNFQMLVMESGAFDWIKQKLQGVLDTIDKMQANGELKQWAQDIGSVIMEVAQGLWAFGEKVFAVVKWLAEFAKENKGVIASVVKWTAVSGVGLSVIGLLTSALSFAVYPIGRLILGFGELTGASKIAEGAFKRIQQIMPTFSKSLLSGKTTVSWFWGTVKSFSRTLINLPSAFIGLFTQMKQLGFWTELLKRILFAAFSPIRMLIMGIGGALGFLASPISLLVIAFVAAGVAIYTHWEKVKAFFSGFWQGLKDGLAPVLEKFKLLGTAFGVVVGWIEKAVKWVMDLITPVKETQEGLDSARSAGETFGQGVAKAIELILAPLALLQDGLKWVSDNMPSWDGIKSGVNKAMAAIGLGDDEDEKSASVTSTAGTVAKIAQTVPNVNKWSGGYAGNGGKYEPMGVFHDGEYIMTKEATSRLGVGLLNRLNYGGKIGATAMLGASVAVAQPLKVDNRPPLKPQQAVGFVQPSASPVINITVQNAGQSSQDIAQEVARQVAQALRQHELEQRAKQRGNFRDR